MATFAVAVLVLTGLLVLVLVTGVAAFRAREVVGVEAGSRLEAVRRRTARWRWAGVIIGLVFGAVALRLDDALGRGIMLAVPLFAVGVLAGVSGGELRVAAPSATTRAARLEVRRVRDYLPRRMTGLVAAATGLLAILLAATTVMASPDDLGRAGRSLVWECAGGATQARGPWPGSFYSVPLALLVAGGLTVALLAASRVVRRPRQGEDRALDDALRRQSAAAVVASTGILVTIPLAGVSAFTAIALLGIACPPGWMAGLGWAVGLLVPVALALGVWCVVVLASPARAALGRRAS